ncbi:serine O-acetyltransferase [Microvenator marinus]|jgi:serine O-acetyltransferase|nr:hypothetical protein [Microvenator marinus]
MNDHEKTDEILDALLESYSGPAEVNNLETHRLPNRREIILAFGHIQHLLFLGYFSTRCLDDVNLRGALAEHLLPAQEILVEQIGRATRWHDRNKPAEERRDDAWCEDVAMELLAHLPVVRERLAGDVRFTFESDPAATSIEEVVFCYPGIFALSAYRVAHRLHELGVPMIPRILTEHAHTRTGIDIHPGAKIGERCFIDHGTGVVIGATCDIGSDAKIYQGVTLGALSVTTEGVSRESPAKRHPTLEDRVTVYAGATILGGETVVGHDSIIGGNVWLTKSVPAGSKIYHRV